MPNKTALSAPVDGPILLLSPNLYQIVDLLAVSVWPPNILAAFIGLPSASLYLLELIVLVKHWCRFKSSFFLLFMFRAIIALLNMALNYMNQRFCKLGWFLPFYQNVPTWLLAIAYFFIYFPFHVENLANFFLLLNRFCSVVFLHQYELIWTYPLTIGCAIFSCLFPLPFTAHILLYQVYPHVQNQSFVLSYTQPNNLQNFIKSVSPAFSFVYKGNNYSAAVSSALFMCICLALNMFTIIAYRMRRNEQTMSREEKIERKMTVYALLTLIGQLMMSIYMFLWYLVSSYWKPRFDKSTYDLTNLALQNQGPWVNDLGTIALPAWLMLFANSRMRRTIRRMMADFKLGAILLKVGLTKGINVPTTVAMTTTAGWTQNRIVSVNVNNRGRTTTNVQQKTKTLNEKH